MKEHVDFFCSCSVLVPGVRNCFCSCSVPVLRPKNFFCSRSVLVPGSHFSVPVLVLVREQEQNIDVPENMFSCSFIPAHHSLESLDDEDRRLLRRLSSISLFLLFLNIIILADIATKTVT